MAEGLRKASRSDRRARKGGLLRRTLKWTCGFGVLVAVLGAAAMVVMYQRTEIPNPNREFQAETTTVYYQGGNKKVGTFAVQNRTTVALSDVPEHVQQAVVAAENRDFWSDAGIDVKGIVRAGLSNARSDSTQGASTITQQYVKVLYLTQERTYKRKIKEAFLSLKVDRELSKEEILQGYLNTIYFGRGAYGIEAASHVYFGKSVGELGVGEGVVLASVLNSPANLDPAIEADNADRLLERYRYVIDGMVEAGQVKSDTGERLKAELPEIKKPSQANRLSGQKGFLLALTERHLRKEGFSEDEIYGGGLKVETTFNFKSQLAAIKAVEEERPEDGKDLNIGVASVQPGTGALRALYGGADYVKSQRNWGLVARQPGSTFKPFTLAAGLEQGVKLTDSFTGNSITVGEDTVNNINDRNYGPLTLEKATEISSNTAYVDLVQKLENGPDDVIDAASRAGIPKQRLSSVPVVTLGVDDVSPVDLANGFATFAAQGEHNNVYVVDKVTDSNGEPRFKHKDNPRRAFSRDIANSVNYALQEVVTDPDGTATLAADLDRPVGGKTGTHAKKNGDIIASWFAGYTRQLATVVVYTRGKNGNAVLDGVGGTDSFTGGGYPGRTWLAMMARAMKGKEVLEWPEVDDLDIVKPPPPSPTKKKEKKSDPTSSETESETPSESPEPTPTKSKPPKPTGPPTGPPTETPTSDCSFLDPDCP
ncbi:MAG: penicillin-binding protein [Propionibacteriales bacterium]|nr:penicillin-binding protein [Propionibacteriales bacterium]